MKIVNISRLLGSSNSKHAHAQLFCKDCCSGFSSQEGLDRHVNYCCGAKEPKMDLPKPEGSKAYFKSWQKSHRNPFAIYADFESLLVGDQNRKNDSGNSTNSQDQIHVPCMFSIKTVFKDGEPPLNCDITYAGKKGDTN